jgi:uncharacterized protein YcbX
MIGRLAWIDVAPVKGLGLATLDAAELGPRGVAENRRFYVLDDRRRLVNGKTAGELVQIRPSYSESTGILALAFPDGTRVEEEVRVGESVSGIFFGYPRAGFVVEGPFSDALSAFAGRPLSLVRGARPGTGVDRSQTGAISLLSSESLNGFDRRRFRMLFGVDDVPAHAEDEWIGREVQIGDAIVLPEDVTGRCLVTSQDPETGRADMDMLEHLRQTRPADLGGEPLPFGVHGSVVRPGRVAVGDPVRIVA